MVFDYSDGDLIMPVNDNLGMDSDGNLHMRMSENYSMDMESGDLHFNSPWKKSDDAINSSLFKNRSSFDTNLSDDENDDDFFSLRRLFGWLL